MIYNIIISVLGIIFGGLVIVFRKKIVNRQIKESSQRDDYLSSRIASYPKADSEKLALLAGLGIILVSLLKIFELL